MSASDKKEVEKITSNHGEDYFGKSKRPMVRNDNTSRYTREDAERGRIFKGEAAREELNYE